MKRVLFILLTISIGITLLQSCHKDVPDDLSDMRHVQISNMYETVSNDIFKTFLYSVIAINDSLYHPNDSTNFRYNDPCITFNLVPFDTITWPKTFHILFPAGGCICFDGISRAGEMMVEIPAPDLPLNSKFEISFNNYSIGTIPVSGYKKIYITSNNNYSFTDTSFLQINSTAPVMQWSSSHHLEWILGSSTHQNITDDLFMYNGKASCIPLSGSSSDEMSFTVNIIEALRFINYCYWIGSGKTEIIPSGKSIRTVTYLDSCINQAMVGADNEFQNITF